MTSNVLKVKIVNENWVGRCVSVCLCAGVCGWVRPEDSWLDGNDGSNTIGEAMVTLKDLSRGRSMEKEFALMPQGFVKVLMYLSIGHGACV